jgi:amino acid transporter
VKNLKKIIQKIDFIKVAELIVVVMIMALPFMALAGVAHADIPQPDCSQLNGVRCDSVDLTGAIIRVLKYVIGIAGLIAVAFLILGGFRYMTSAGNEEMVEKGKKTIINALIGIAVVILSYVIVGLISNTVSNAGGK